jgi:ATP-dependent DNA ligase
VIARIEYGCATVLEAAVNRTVMIVGLVTVIAPILTPAARTRNGFTPALRESLFKLLSRLEVKTFPFSNLPEKSGGRWGQGLTAARMKECRWLKPVTVGQFESVEWTSENHLRHSKFVGLREDKKAREVVREP